MRSERRHATYTYAKYRSDAMPTRPLPLPRAVQRNLDRPHCEAAGMPLDLQATGVDDDTTGDDTVGFDVSGDDASRPAPAPDASAAMDPNNLPTDVPDDATAPTMGEVVESFMKARAAKKKVASEAATFE